MDGTSYSFDTNECVMMFKRFRSVYGDDFEKLLAPHPKNNLFLTNSGIGQFQLSKK
jgi:hypothetical protein